MAVEDLPCYRAATLPAGSLCPEEDGFTTRVRGQPGMLAPFRLAWGSYELWNTLPRDFPEQHLPAGFPGGVSAPSILCKRHAAHRTRIDFPGVYLCALKALSVILRCQQIDIALYVLSGRAGGSEQGPFAGPKQSHATAAAGASGPIPGGHFGCKSLAGIVRFRHPHLASRFTFGRTNRSEEGRVGKGGRCR